MVVQGIGIDKGAIREIPREMSAMTRYVEGREEEREGLRGRVMNAEAWLSRVQGRAREAEQALANGMSRCEELKKEIVAMRSRVMELEDREASLIEASWEVSRQAEEAKARGRAREAELEGLREANWEDEERSQAVEAMRTLVEIVRSKLSEGEAKLRETIGRREELERQLLELSGIGPNRMIVRWMERGA
jgi:chromosome segregation ATPase